MTKRVKVAFRRVKPMNPAIWHDAYDYLAEHNEEWLNGVETSVGQGYTPEEIHRHVMREAGMHRLEIAKRCENAARHIISDQGDGG